MRTITIESNGRIEKTAVYVNGEQISGIRELLISIDEEGTFNAILSFIGITGELHTKQLFTEDLSTMKRKEASFTEIEAQELRSITIESDGTLDNTTVLINNEFAEGIISLSMHILIDMQQQSHKSFLKRLFSKEQSFNETRFITEIVFRNPDGSEQIETIF